MGTKITFAGVTTTLTKTGAIRRPAASKMLRSGLVTARTTMKLTDDYAFDNAYDFGRGATDPIALAADIDDGRKKSGWTIYLETSASGKQTLKISCHSFRYLEAVEDAEGAKAAAPEFAYRRASNLRSRARTADGEARMFADRGDPWANRANESRARATELEALADAAEAEAAAYGPRPACEAS